MDELQDKYSHFVQCVNEVILSRDLHQPIQTFRLWCCSLHCDPKNVNIWVNVALQLRVEHLHLFLSPSWLQPIMNLPPAILTHRTLVVLKLEGLKLKAISSVDLPSLKILHLENVTFLESRYLAELLSGCPVLEDLVAKELRSDKHFPYYLAEGDFKRLNKLVRADIHKRYVPLLILNNVEFLSIDKGYDADHVLNDEEIDMEKGDDPKSYAKHLIPVFHNLVNIELTFFYYSMNWLDVIEVIKRCPKLQILISHQHFNYVDDYDDIDWRYPRSGVPKCISLHLKTCQLNNYRGSKGEVRLVRYIMRNARILQTMKICVFAD